MTKTQCARGRAHAATSEALRNDYDPEVGFRGGGQDENLDACERSFLDYFRNRILSGGS